MTVGTLAYSIAMCVAMSLCDEDPDAITIPLTAVAWPPLLHLCYLAVVNNWVPVAYLLRPPRYPDRRGTLNEEEHNITVKLSH